MIKMVQVHERPIARTDRSSRLGGHMIRGNLVDDLQRSPSPPPASVYESPVSHIHLRERSSFPALLRFADSFAITRLESSSGLADTITKVSSVPALLVVVAIKPLADYQVWVDNKSVPTPNISPFRSSVIDLDAQLTCWPGSAFDWVMFHIPRKGLDDIAADLAVRPVGTYKLSRHQDDLVTHERITGGYCGSGGLCGSSGVHSHLPSDRGHQSRSMEARSSAPMITCFIRVSVVIEQGQKARRNTGPTSRPWISGGSCIIL